MQRFYVALLQQDTQQVQSEAGGVFGVLGRAAEGFIGLFREGADVFVGFVTDIIPLLIVLLTAFYTVINLIGEERVRRVAGFAAGTAFTRYTLLPLLAVFFLTNPMCYTFGTFLEEKHKPAFYDSAVSMVHPPLGLFPHVNAAELFVWLGIASGIQRLDLPIGDLAIRYLLAGLVVALLRGILTQFITLFLARRQGIEF